MELPVKCTFRATPLPNGSEGESLQDVSDQHNVIDILLQCSNFEEPFIDVINCHEWSEAIVGWKATVPNPTYITCSSTPLHDNKAKPRQEKGSKKDKQTNKKNLYKEPQWRNKIEPGTYRYNPQYNPDYAWKFQGQNTKHYTNIKKRATDPQLIEHIERVREHLEKTLMKKEKDHDASKAKTSHFDAHHIHNVMQHISEDSQKKTEHKHVRLSQSLTDLKSYSFDKQSLLQTLPRKIQLEPVSLEHETKPCFSNTVKPTNASGDHTSTDPQLPNVTVVSKKSGEPPVIASDGDKTGINPSSNSRQGGKENNNSLTLKKPSERHSSAGKLPSSTLNIASKSFENFQAFTTQHLDQQHLNPLTKLTPSMRKISDDNEVIMVHFNGARCDASPSSAPASVSSGIRERTPIQKKSPQYKVDAPNKNFIHNGINGKSVSPIDHHKVKNKSTKLGVKNTNKTNTPHRLASLGKPSEYHANPLESLHRGAFERDTASAIASELLPGISGRKVGVPVLSHRVL